MEMYSFGEFEKWVTEFAKELPWHFLLNWPAWIVWSIIIMLLTRLLLALLFRSVFQFRNEYLAAYMCIAGLFPLGLIIISASGMEMYGFDDSDWRQWVGYLTLTLSPFGIPLVMGTPFVIIFDLVRRPWRSHV